MNQKIEISPVGTLPPHLEDEIGRAAGRENFRSIQRLLNDWATGVNRFDGPGETFYAAEFNGRLVGVCGVNRDPFAYDVTVARLRRLYILPRFRRLGIGRQLVLRACRDAGGHFRLIRLRTMDSDSAAFFESIGFARVKGLEGVTHTMRIDSLLGTG